MNVLRLLCCNTSIIILKYPAIARENGVEGQVVLQFVVDREGKITETKNHAGYRCRMWSRNRICRPWDERYATKMDAWKTKRKTSKSALHYL